MLKRFLSADLKNCSHKGAKKRSVLVKKRKAILSFLDLEVRWEWAEG
jgi:hypothetical protein